MSTCPWKNNEFSDLSSLMRIRPKDVGLEGTATTSTVPAAVAAAAGTVNSQSSTADASDPLVIVISDV